ncbi:hypothetical protein ACP3TC_04865 [Winslowiella sp. 2C04]|uniref:hypothetical protein n=1 Tax=Winslowiella sp. 2C04 TaxID=3416179 RepID=UPI003CFBC1C7
MYKVENVRVMFIDDSDIQDPAAPLGYGALKPEVDKANLEADIIIYQNKMIKNRFGNAERFPFTND